MLSTIILDTFTNDEKEQIAAALDDLCSPADTYGFSCAAIYAFWSVPQRELLYIGLTKNIALRFRQHVGLVKCDPKCCKVAQITDYFQSNERLGYSVLVQSSLMQVVGSAEARALEASLPDLPDDLVSDEVNLEDVFGTEQEIAVAEGMLLELHRQLGDKLPKWNKVGGAVAGRKRRSLYSHAAQLSAIADEMQGKSPQEIDQEIEAKGPPFELLLNLEGSELSVLNAHSTLREMSADPKTGYYEILLHGVRMLVVTQMVSYESALHIHRHLDDTVKQYFEEMTAQGYLEKQVVLPGF